MMRRVVCLFLVTVVACDGPGIASPGAGRLGRAGATQPATAIVGTWRRVLFFLDDFNYSRSSETTFQFAPDGAALRVQVARNYTLGLTDVLVAAGRWRLQGTRLVLDFVTPTPFQLALDARLTGDQLDLAGQVYLRVLE